MPPLDTLKSRAVAGLRKGASAARGGQVAAVREGQAALGFSGGLASEVAQGGIGLGTGLIRNIVGPNPFRYSVIPKLGVAVPTGLRTGTMARMSLLGVAGATAVGVATIGSGEEGMYQYPDEPDGVGPQFKRNLGADGNLVIQSHYAGRKY